MVLLFYKCLPDKSMVLKTEKSHGGKHSKERVTIIHAAYNRYGETEALSYWKSIKPPCFASAIRNFAKLFSTN